MSRTSDAAAGDEFAFRLDQPIPQRFFGDQLQISGWLLHRAGRPIHGIRVIVRRRLGREHTITARRKRTRPDAEAAFPDLPEAKASGFFVEVPLSLGKQELRLQVRDESRVWRTFHLATVRAQPLKSLRRLGFPRTRQLILERLKHSHAQTTYFPPKLSSTAASQSKRVVRRVNLFATTKSNLFILEIAQLIAAGFRDTGRGAEVHLDQPPELNPPDDTLQIIVTPHEFFNLYLTDQVTLEEARALCRRAILLCTEQPETHWFESNLRWVAYAEGIADIHPLGVLASCARGIPCQHLPLGYHPMLRATPSKPPNERKTEITFLGSLTERREEFFARHADFFSKRQAHLRFVPLEFAKTAATRSYLEPEARNNLLADTRVLLNVHYSERSYFEWHRMLIGLANGCCLITEPCEGYGLLVPGKHFVMVEAEHLIAACDYYLNHPEECSRIARQGQEFVEQHLTQVGNCETYLRSLSVASCQLSPDSSPFPFPSKLRHELRSLRRRRVRNAVAADLHSLFRQDNPMPNEQRTESEPDLAQQRREIIEKRSGYQQRLKDQKRLVSEGKPIWKSYVNASYEASPTPAISVVVTLYNYAQFINDCLASIERAATELTAPLEVLIVDDGSTDDSLTQALHYQKQSQLPIRIIAKHWNTGLADARNVGTDLARAPFVFMMDADNLVFPGAFRQLLAAISLNDRAAAYSLLCRFKETPAAGIGLLSSYDWDPQILVQQPYVDAMALFRRDTLLELGGYDSSLSQIGWFGWEDYDLWLRIADRDLAVGFVANIQCLYRQHGTSMLRTTNVFELDLVRHFQSRFANLCARFEPQAKLFGVERRKFTPRKTSFFVVCGCDIVTTSLYRCVHLQEQLRTLGHQVTIVSWKENSDLLEGALSHDVIVLYRVPMSPLLRQMIEQVHKSDGRIIFDTDDLVFEPELISWHRAVAQLSPPDQQLHREGVQRYRETLLGADIVTTATPVLAEMAKGQGKIAYVHRNALGNEMLALANQLAEARCQHTPSQRLIIIYGSGTHTHDVDFLAAAPALARVLAKQPQVELWIAGALTLPELLTQFSDRITRFPITDWRSWFELMSKADIAIAPLEPDNIFCSAKSEIKWMEAGALGIPIIASHVGALKDAIEDGVTGLLATSDNEWEAALIQLIKKPDLRERLGETARQAVLERYTPSARTKDLEKFLQCASLSERARENQASLRLNWLVPEPYPGAGGDVGIFRMIRELAEMGHDCHVYVVAYSLMTDYDTEAVRSYMQKHFGASKARYYRFEEFIREADITFATFWPTAEIVLKLTNSGERYYFVQDFEPDFYPDDPPHYQRAEATYRAGFRCITLGPWLTRLLRERYQATSDYFDFAVDTQTYWPRPSPHSSRQRICFYARPATPRRGYELGLHAFRLVNRELPEVEIVFFGADEVTPPPSFPFVNRGKLSQEELACLFSSCDLGVVFSFTNPSFVPLEMMACGCPVVEIASERWQGVLTHGKDAWLVEPTPQSVAAGILELLGNNSLREQLRLAGLEKTRTMSWQDSARQVEDILLRDTLRWK